MLDSVVALPSPGSLVEHNLEQGLTRLANVSNVSGESIVFVAAAVLMKLGDATNFAGRRTLEVGATPARFLLSAWYLHQTTGEARGAGVTQPSSG